ncbi:AAA family ATPase [Streptomyces sp. NPDC007808]|uniref:AAA family ATPase n=1 Tax=Streptomyces sp. NPDC007808 TaxID=3364779 RepID=UPI003692ECBF
MQELIGRRSRAGFVGRGAERAAFRANLDIPPEDERHRFLFHVHGNAGVGKSFLLRELEQIARERGALTAYVDEGAGSVPEVLEAVSRQFAAQGRRLKDLDRLLTAHRERLHEAELAALTAQSEQPGQQPGPSAGSMAVARAGLVGLGMVPGIGAFAGALDPTQLAEGAERLRSGLGARFRTHEDARLVLAPEGVLTPVLLEELSQAASAAPWIVLFFDTYERTGRFLDRWLHTVMTSERYGPLPATVVVVTAGQLPFDAARWGAFGDFMTDLPLLPFTESETRDLLAGKGVVAEPVVWEVLRLTGGLPVLVSTLAESRPADPADVGDPSATAVEWFLKREADPVRRSVALACALPRRLDADVFRAVVGLADAELDGLYAWLRGLPFVSERGGLVRYHDVVRAPMLRLQRRQAPRTWAARQQALASVFREWRSEAEAGRSVEERWADETWRELRLAELYHLLCAGQRSALTSVLGDVVDACEQGESAAERWARVLVEAGADAETWAVTRWGQRLAAALDAGGPPAALDLVLRATGFEPASASAEPAAYGAPVAAGPGVPAAWPVAGATASGTEWGTAAAAASPGPSVPAGTGGVLYRERPRRPGAAATRPGSPGDGPPDEARQGGAPGGPTATPQPDPQDEDVEPSHLVPQDQHTQEAAHSVALADHPWANEMSDADWRVHLAPAAAARAYRASAMAHDLAGDVRAAVARLDRALELAPDDPRSLALRGEYHRALDHHDEAIRDLDRALALNPADAFALASRGATRLSRREYAEALTDLDRAVELKPDYPWALVRRARVHRALGDPARQLADLDLAVAVDPDWAWVRCERGDALRVAGRDEEALADYDHALALEPGYGSARASRGASLANLGRYEEALAELDRVLERRPSYTWAADQRAAVLSRLREGSATPARTAGTDGARAPHRGDQE